MLVGIDIGGTKTLVAVADDPGHIIASQKIATPANPADCLSQIIDITSRLAIEPISGACVAIAGAVDRQAGQLRFAPSLGWRDIAITAPLAAKFDVPVVLENDASAGCLAEAHSGAGQNSQTVLYVAIGTGVGTGISVGGRILEGTNGSEGGHIIIRPDGPICPCGGQGHLHALISGTAIKQRFGVMAGDITDPKIWDDIAADLAIGIHTMISLLSPDVVVLGGGVSTHFDRFSQPLQDHLQSLHPLYPLPPVVQAKFTETAVVLGCLMLAAGQQANAGLSAPPQL